MDLRQGDLSFVTGAPNGIGRRVVEPCGASCLNTVLAAIARLDLPRLRTSLASS
jgi:hypothetical protein